MLLILSPLYLQNQITAEEVKEACEVAMMKFGAKKLDNKVKILFLLVGLIENTGY